MVRHSGVATAILAGLGFVDGVLERVGGEVQCT